MDFHFWPGKAPDSFLQQLESEMAWKDGQD